jgi:hypothetical protein
MLGTVFHRFPFVREIAICFFVIYAHYLAHGIALFNNLTSKDDNRKRKAFLKKAGYHVYGEKRHFIDNTFSCRILPSEVCK